jgi:hypothetical protein
MENIRFVKVVTEFGSRRIDCMKGIPKHMRDLPNRLECAYCIRNHEHGGECRSPKYDDVGCLIFKPDPKGCIRRTDLRLEIPLYKEIPPLKTWWDEWKINGVATEINIRQINALKWDKRNGKLIIYCHCLYYENEFGEDYEEPKEKPKLKVLQGGDDL